MTRDPLACDFGSVMLPCHLPLDRLMMVRGLTRAGTLPLRRSLTSYRVSGDLSINHPFFSFTYRNSYSSPELTVIAAGLIMLAGKIRVDRWAVDVMMIRSRSPACCGSLTCDSQFAGRIVKRVLGAIGCASSLVGFGVRVGECQSPHFPNASR